jgi:hypothetical protein
MRNSSMLNSTASKAYLYSTAAQRWPSAAARDKHSKLKERSYLRSMLSRRQLQGFVMLR